MKAGIVGGGAARGSNPAALRERGLHLKSPLGDARTGPLRASADPREIGPVDALFMTTKLYDLYAVASMSPALVGPSTLVIPVPNGVEAHEILTPALPGAAVLNAMIYISSFRTKPSKVDIQFARQLLEGHGLGLGDLADATTLVISGCNSDHLAGSGAERCAEATLTFIAGAAPPKNAPSQSIPYSLAQLSHMILPLAESDKGSFKNRSEASGYFASAWG